MHITLLTLASSLLAHLAWAQAPAESPPQLAPSTQLKPLPRGDAGRQLPIVLRAARVSSQADLETVAEGDVEFRRGGLVIRSDRLTYDSPQDLAKAKGQVRVALDGALYTGPELALQVQRLEGYFLQPQFEFLQLGSGGRADRVDFVGQSRVLASNANYTSCPREGPAEPAWLLKMDRLSLDFDTQTGVAEGAVLRFLGVPILAWPSLSFPLGDQRKTGWLPPTVGIDNRSGIDIAVPFYWDIAPQRDATLTPRFVTRRGFGVTAEFRFLQATDSGEVLVDWLPNDRVANRSRQGIQWLHQGRTAGGVTYQVDVLRVSDNDWWKDFPDAARSLTPRLLPTRFSLQRPFELAGLKGQAYARALHWQVLQAADSAIAAPYQRSPQIGVQMTGDAGPLRYTLESEYNRFTLPDAALARAGRRDGDRVHFLGSVSLPYRVAGAWVVPRLALNTASYRLLGNDTGSGTVLAPIARGQSTRSIVTVSVDAGLDLERNTRIFGRDLQQTLEPRLLYVNTPYRPQSQLPVFDAAGKDFSFASLFTDNAFAGIDRVSDSHQITAGVTSRLVDAASGAEALRLGFAQRYLLRTQRVTAQADGSPDGEPLQQRLSDALLLGSTNVIPNWSLGVAFQYSPDISRLARSSMTAGYTPGPYRTVAASYGLARGSGEQFEVGWQWPVWGRERATSAQRSSSSGSSCEGAWYSVGRINYSIKDSRVTGSVLGLEFDAGCWIGRIVATRLSTGLSEATNRLGIQLELSGLSKLNLGTNPLKVLKDNVPGFRLLREDSRSRPGEGEWQPTP